jgi:16S rRNA processing protein RimM
MTTRVTMVPIAKIGKPHGLKGDVTLRPYNMHSDLIRAGLKVVVRPAGGGAEVAMEVLSARPGGPQAVVVRLDLVTNRNKAEEMVHAEVFVPRDSLPPTEDDEIYLVDTIGLPVLLASSAGGEPRLIGAVLDVFETKANDVLTVKLTRGGPDLLVPVIPEAFSEMRPETGRIVLAPLEDWAPDDLVIEGGEA